MAAVDTRINIFFPVRLTAARATQGAARLIPRMTVDMVGLEVAVVRAKSVDRRMERGRNPESAAKINRATPVRTGWKTDLKYKIDTVAIRSITRDRMLTYVLEDQKLDALTGYPLKLPQIST